MHRVLTGAPALRSVVNVGEGMAGLVLLPLQHYRKDGRVLRGLRRGTMRCLKGLTVETLSATHKVGD
jgi:autophagy-related protein 2